MKIVEISDSCFLSTILDIEVILPHNRKNTVHDLLNQEKLLIYISFLIVAGVIIFTRFIIFFSGIFDKILVS